MHKNPNCREIEHFPIWGCKNVLEKYKYNIKHRVHLKEGNTPQHFYGVHHPGQVFALLDSARPYHAFNTTDIRHCNKEVMLAFRSIAVLNGVEIMFCSHF